MGNTSQELFIELGNVNYSYQRVLVLLLTLGRGDGDLGGASDPSAIHPLESPPLHTSKGKNLPLYAGSILLPVLQRAMGSREGD